MPSEIAHLLPDFSQSHEARVIANIQAWSWSGCWEWGGWRDDGGYGRLKVAGRKWRAHRIAWLFWRGEIPEGLCVLHRCDNPPCCNPVHLFLGTQADNISDCVAKGRQVHFRGEDHVRAKLTWAKVREIRARHAAGEAGYKVLAREYGVGRTAIQKIVKAERWLEA